MRKHTETRQRGTVSGDEVYFQHYKDDSLGEETDSLDDEEESTSTGSRSG